MQFFQKSYRCAFLSLLALPFSLMGNALSDADLHRFIMLTNSGETAPIRQMIDEGVSVAAVEQALGFSILEQPLFRDNFEVTELLLEHGADPDRCSSGGVPILVFAAENNLIKGVEQLLKYGAFVDARTAEQNNTALIVAALCGNSGVIRKLLAAGADKDAVNLIGFTPILAAVNAGNEESALLLFWREADIKKRSKRGYSLLTIAAASGLSFFVTVLLGHGVSIDEQDDNGRTALMAALINHKSEMVSLLLKRGALVHGPETLFAENTLHFAAASGEKAVVSACIKQGVDLNARNAQGRTALARAAFSCNLDIVKMLLEAGADHAIRDNDGDTPLLQAVRSQRTYSCDCGYRCMHVESEELYDELQRSKVVAALLDAGADVNALNNRQGSALMFAAHNNPQGGPTVAMLLEKGAYVNQVDSEGNTALKAAVSDEIKKQLQMYGATIDGKNTSGSIKDPQDMSLFEVINEDKVHFFGKRLSERNVGKEEQNQFLTYALNAGSANIFELLLHKYKDVTIDPTHVMSIENATKAKNQYGESMLHLAIRYERPHLVKALFELGADSSVVTEKGESVLQYARATSFETMWAVLAYAHPAYRNGVKRFLAKHYKKALFASCLFGLASALDSKKDECKASARVITASALASLIFGAAGWAMAPSKN